MTSNIGSQWISELGPKDHDEMRRRVDEALRAHFRPEFLNRVDEVLIFRALEPEQIAKIVDVQLERVAKRLADRKLTLDVTPEASAYLAREGYDPAYGARPLKRTIQRLILDPLSIRLLAGEFLPGDTIVADVGAEGIVFTRNPTSDTREATPAVGRRRKGEVGVVEGEFREVS
jgi:ATP-dependent Clp protease ATP-binding subunit ClpB